MTVPRPPAPDWSPEELRRLGHQTVEIIAEYLTSLPRRPVFQPYPTEAVVLDRYRWAAGLVLDRDRDRDLARAAHSRSG